MKSSSTRRPGIGAASRPKAGARPAGRSSAVPGSRSAADVASPGARATPRGETAMRRTRAGSRTGEARTARGAAAKSLAGQAAPGPAAVVRPTGREGLRQMMSGNAARRLGIELVSASPRRVVARIAVGAEHLNRGERVNGGVLMAFADLLGAAGTVLNLPAGHRTTTLESKTNFFAAGQGPVITATSTPLHIGRSTSVWQTRIENADGRLVAIVTQTQIILPPAAASS